LSKGTRVTSNIARRKDGKDWKKKIGKKKAGNKKVIARGRSGNSRSNGTRAEDEQVPNKRDANRRRRQPLGQMPAHPNIPTVQCNTSYGTVSLTGIQELNVITSNALMTPL
jgi:hypothetical protein